MATNPMGWTRTMTVSAGTYKFTATADDGVRLLVDGVAIIDKWVDQSATPWTAIMALTSGAHTVVLEYYENTWDAVAQLTIGRG